MSFGTQFTPYPGRLRYAQAMPLTRVTANGATEGTATDVSEAEGNIAIQAQALQATAGTTPTLTFTVEHRASASDSWGAVPAAALIDPSTGEADTFNVVTDAANGGLQVLELVRSLCKAQIRLVATVGSGGGSPTFLFGGAFVFSPKYGDQ